MYEQATIRLDKDDALVLYELLARLDETDSLEIEDSAERVSLWRLHGALEKLLVEPLSPEYRVLLEGARARVRERGGVE